MSEQHSSNALFIYPVLFLLGLVCGIWGDKVIEAFIQALDRRMRLVTQGVVHEHIDLHHAGR